MYRCCVQMASVVSRFLVSMTTSSDVESVYNKMVRVTVPYLTKKGSPNAPKHGKETKEHTRKLTHLYLNDQYIDSIGDISSCKNVRVLFLQNNLLEKIDNLDFASQLTHLYLQRNKLSQIQGFDGLVSLKKLYLGHNCISVVEGLENSRYLLELHLEYQKLCPGEEIVCDPRTIAALGSTLDTLNLQGNSLTSLEDLVGLENLKTLLVANNNLNDVTKIQAFLTALPSLAELDMRDNPVVQDYKNCNKIIASTQNLRVFNERQISVTTLDFMKRFEEHQQKAMVHRSLHTTNDIISSISAELAYNLPEALAKDVTNSIFMNSSLSKSSRVNVVGSEEHSTSKQAVFTSSDSGPFFHFPAFKSSTSLQYDGHIIPKPFHRQIILGAQLSQSHHHSRKLKSHWSTNLPPKIGNKTLDAKVNRIDNVPDPPTALKQAGCGDLEWSEKDVSQEPTKTSKLEKQGTCTSQDLICTANQIKQ